MAAGAVGGGDACVQQALSPPRGGGRGTRVGWPGQGVRGAGWLCPALPDLHNKLPWPALLASINHGLGFWEGLLYPEPSTPLPGSPGVVQGDPC